MILWTTGGQQKARLRTEGDIVDTRRDCGQKENWWTEGDLADRRRIDGQKVRLWTED